MDGWGEREEEDCPTRPHVYDPDHMHTSKVRLQGDKSMNRDVLKWPSQSPTLDLCEIPSHELKISIHCWSPSNTTEHDQLCQEELANILGSGVQSSQKHILGGSVCN